MYSGSAALLRRSSGVRLTLPPRNVMQPDSTAADPRRELLEDARASLLHAQIELDEDNPPDDVDLERVRDWVSRAVIALEEAMYDPEAAVTGE